MFYKVFVSLWKSFLNFSPTEKWLLQFSQGLHSWVWKGQLLSFSVINDVCTEVNSKIKQQILCSAGSAVWWPLGKNSVQAGIFPSPWGSDLQLQEAWLLEIYMDFSSIFEESVRIKRHLKIPLLAVHNLFPSNFVLWHCCWTQCSRVYQHTQHAMCLPCPFL